MDIRFRLCQVRSFSSLVIFARSNTVFIAFITTAQMSMEQTDLFDQ